MTTKSKEQKTHERNAKLKIKEIANDWNICRKEIQTKTGLKLKDHPELTTCINSLFMCYNQWRKQ